MNESMIIQCSGGFDSAAVMCFCVAEYKTHRLIPHFFDYGQPYAEQEQRAAEYVRDELAKGCNRIEPLFVTRCELPRAELKSDYFPLRNLVLASLSASLAVARGAEMVAVGSKTTSLRENDAWCFADCTSDFYEQVTKTISEGSERELKAPRIIRPLVAHDYTPQAKALPKSAVLRLIESFGLKFERLWNCYRAQSEPCGECYHCLELEKAKKELHENYHSKKSS